jgi:hypothetical protein
VRAFSIYIHNALHLVDYLVPSHTARIPPVLHGIDVDVDGDFTGDGDRVHGDVPSDPIVRSRGDREHIQGDERLLDFDDLLDHFFKVQF